MTKYIIIFKNKDREPIKNLSFEEVLTFVLDNQDKKDTFEYAEQIKSGDGIRKKRREKEEKNDEALAKERTENRKRFMKNLSDNQRKGLEDGTREIKYSQSMYEQGDENGGWYLKVIHKDSEAENRFSLEALKREKDEEDLEGLKSALKYESFKIYSCLDILKKEDFPYSRFEELFFKLLK